jgi:hypothetical protein
MTEIPGTIDQSSRFRCAVCGAVSDAAGLVLEGPLRPPPVPTTSLTEDELRQRSNAVGNLLAEFIIFTRDHTTVVEARKRIQRLVLMLDDLYAPTTTAEPSDSAVSVTE